MRFLFASDRVRSGWSLFLYGTARCMIGDTFLFKVTHFCIAL